MHVPDRHQNRSDRARQKRRRADRRLLPTGLLSCRQLTMLAGVIACLLLNAVPTHPAGPPTPQVQCRDDRITIQVQDAPAAEVIAALSAYCGIVFEGPAPSERRISLTQEAEPTAVGIRSLMRQMAIDSYALEYWHHRIRKIRVPGHMQQASTPIVSPTPAPSTSARIESEPAAEAGSVTAVRVRRLAEGHQSRSAGLAPGDLIVAYDGTPIANTRTLRRATQSKAETDQVDLSVIRDGIPVIMHISGGTIGVFVEDIRLPADDMARYRESFGNP